MKHWSFTNEVSSYKYTFGDILIRYALNAYKIKKLVGKLWIWKVFLWIVKNVREMCTDGLKRPILL